MEDEKNGVTKSSLLWKMKRMEKAMKKAQIKKKSPILIMESYLLSGSGFSVVQEEGIDCFSLPYILHKMHIPCWSSHVVESCDVIIDGEAYKSVF